MAASTASSSAAVLWKDGSLDALNLATSWWTTEAGATDGTVPTSADVLRFGGSGQGASIAGVNLGGSMTISGIRHDNNTGTPNYNVVINGSAGQVLTLNAGTSDATGMTNTGYGIALISGTGGSLTLNNDVALGATQQWVTGNTRGITMNGALNLGAFNLGFNVAGGTQTVAGVISGTGSVTKAGAGTLNLNNAANTFTGSLTGAGAFVGGLVNVTSLKNAGSADSLGNQAAGSRNIALNGTTFAYNGADASVTDRGFDLRASSIIQNSHATGTVQFTSSAFLTTLTASARTLTLQGTSTGNNVFGGAIANSGTGANTTQLIKSGTGTWVLTGASTATGGTIINQGTLRLSGSSARLPGVAGVATDAGNIWFSSANTGAILEFEEAAQLGAAGQIRFRNSGGTAGNGGMLRFIGTTNQVVSKDIQCDSTIGVRLSSESATAKVTYNGSFATIVGGTRPVYLEGSSTTLNEVAAAIGTGINGLTKRGAGTWVLSGNSTYTAATAVTAGTLMLGHANALGTTAAGTSVTAGAVLDLNGIAVGAEALTLNGTGISSGGALINSSGTAATHSGAITLASAASLGGSGNTTLLGAVGGGFALTKVGAGTVTLGATNTNSAGTTVSAGLLSVTGSLGAVSVASGADLGGTGTVGAVTLADNADLVAGVNGLGSLTTGNVTIDAAAAGGLVISGLSNYTSTAAFALGDLSFGAGSTLKVKASGFSIGTGFRLFTYTGTNAALVESSNLILENTGLGRLQVSLDLATANEVKYNVTGAKNYWTGAAGADWQASGQANWNIAAESDTTTFLAGDLVVFGAGQGNRAVNLAGDVSPGSLEVEGADDYSFSSSGNFGILGTGALVKSGAGKLTINTANAFSGGATLQAGRTVLGSDTALGAGTLTLAGGTLSSSGSAARSLANAVIVSGDVALGHADDLGRLTFGGATFGLGGATRTLTLATGAEVVISGIVSNGGLVLAGSGDVTLSNANTFADGVTVSAGRLRVGNNSALGTGTLTLAAGTTLSSADSNAVTLANTVVINGDVTLGNATQNGALSLAGNQDLGGGVRTLTTPSNVTLTGVLSNGSLTKAGNGTLTLSGASTFEGGITVNAGTLALGAANRIADANAVSLASGTTLNLAGFAETIGALAVDTATVSGGTLTAASVSANAGTISSILAGSGNLTKTGAGTLVLTGTNTYSGTTTISAGTLQVGNNGATGLVGTGAVSVASGATLAFNRASGANQVSANLSGSGDVTKSGAGEMSITGTNALTGSLTVSGGKFAFDGANSSGDFSSVTVAAGAKISLGTAYSSTTNPTGFVLLRNLSGAGTVDAEWGGSNDSRSIRLESTSGTTFSGVLADGVTSRVLVVRKTGAGTLVLTGSNTHSGATTVAQGTLQIGDGGATGDIGTVSTTNAVTIDSGATLRFYRSGAPDYSASARMRYVTGAGDIIIEGTGAGGASVSPSLSIKNAPGSTTGYADANSWSTFSGNLVIKGGAEYQTTRNGSTAMGTALVTLGEAGVSSGALTQYNGNWSWTNNIVLAGSDNAIRSRSTGSDRILRLFGTISGSGNVTFDDAGAAMGNVDRGFVLIGENTMSGNVTVNGIVRVGAIDDRNPTLLFTAGTTGSLGTANVTINSGKVLAFTRSNAHTVGNLISGAGKVHIGSATAVGAGTSSPNTSAASTFTQELTLAGANTYSGGTEFLAGTLNISTLGNIGSGYLAIKGIVGTGRTAVLNYTGASESTDRLLYVDSGNATFNVTQSGTVLTFTDSTALKGGGSGGVITKAGAGTLALSGALTAGGSTAISVTGGRLLLTAANTGAISTTIAAESTLEIGGAGTLTAAPVAANGTLLVNSTASFTLGGALTGSGSLTKSNNGILTLGSENAGFGGSATVNGGKLVLGHANALGGRGITVASGGTLDLGGLAVTSAVTLAGGTLEQFGAYTGTLTTSGSNTLNGTLASTFVNSGTTTTSTGLTFSGILKGTGTLAGDVTVSGAHNPGNSPGLQTVDGNLTYSGGASTVQWELTTETASSAQAGIAYDQIVVTGDLTFAGATALTLVFNGAGSDVAWTDSFWNVARSWTLYDVTGSLTSFGNLSITDAVAYPLDGVMAVSNVQDASGATLASVRSEAGFYLGNVGSDVRLFYRPIPEPSTYGVLLAALGLAAAATRRRKSHPKA